MISLKTTRNSSDTNLPQIIYQNVDVDISVQHGSLHGYTTMWLVFKNPVKEGDTFRIHSRYHAINDIHVNGVATSFCRKDGLRVLNVDSSGKRKTLFLGEEMDLLNRSALEISRQGELEITIPNLAQMKFEPLRPVSKSAPKEILHRFDKLSGAYVNLTTRRDYGTESSSATIHDNAAGDDAASVASEIPEHSTKFVQVKIQFAILADGISTYGIVFRRQPGFAQDLYNYLTGKGAKVSEPSSSSAANKSAGAKGDKSIKAVYTTNNQSGSFYDVDGVRCWLPCLDMIDQRAVFDVNISVSRTFHVTCSGMKLAAVRNAQRPKAGRLIHRFFTVQRIPAMQLGFFVGKIESYRMPLFQAKSRVWVLKGIQDVIIRNDKIGEEHHIDNSATTDNASQTKAHAQPQPDEKLKRALESYVSRDLKASGATNTNNDPQSATSAGLTDSATKRRRLDTEGRSSTNPQKDVFAPPEGSISSSRLQHALDSRRLAAEEDRRLYFDAVHHTMLAFDIAVQLIHKFTGHKLINDELAVIYVPDLGQDFMSFEGMILVDMKFLHDINQVYKEYPAHQVLIEAYLYSWLKSTIPLAWYGLEFIVHGLVGYLKYFYKEEIDGEDEGQCYLHRMKNNVAAMEKAGFGESMMQLHPENNYIFNRQYGEYLRARSTLLFLMLESKIGGKDPMRLALKELIKSPLIFHETTLKSGPRQFASNSSDQSPLLPSVMHSPTPSHRLSRDYQRAMHGHHPHMTTGGESVYSAGSLSPSGGGYAYNAQCSTGGETPYQTTMGLHSPYHGQYGAGALTPGGGGNSSLVNQQASGGYVSNERFSRHNYMTGTAYGAISPRSPYHGSGAWNRGALSPMSMSEGNGNMSPPQFGRQGSVTSYTSWEQIAAELLQSECLTAASFVTLFQSVSDTFDDFGEDLLEKYVEKSGFGFYNVKVRCDDGKKITVRTEQVGYDRAGNISKRFSTPDTLTMIMVEECDDFVSKFSIGLGDCPHTYEKPVYTRPGRRKERGLNAKERSLRSALDIVRTSEAYTVKYTVIDPTETYFSDVFFACNDMQLVEMLFGDYKEVGPQVARYKTLIRAQALHSLIRSDASSDPRLQLGQLVGTAAPTKAASGAANESDAIQNLTSGRLADKSAEVEVLSLQEVVLNSARDGKELNFPMPLRIDAIYGLSTWQNHHAPEMIVEGDDKHNAWPAMEALISCLFELFVDADTNEVLPVHLHDENECALRYALLLSLASIRCKRGYTPPEVVDVLLFFAEYLTEDYQQRMMDLEHAKQDAKKKQRQAKLSSAKSPASLQGPVKDKPRDMDETNTDEEENDSNEDDNEDTNNNNSDELKTAEPDYDDTQYRSVLFLALSRVRFFTMHLDDTSHPIHRIIQLAKATIQRAFGDAKVDARIAFDRILLHHEDMHLVSGTPQLLPKLPGEGIEVAAAMTCLSEMDIQTTLAFPRLRAKPTDQLSAADILPKSARVRPHPFGLISGFNFLRCIVPPSRKIVCTDLSKENNEPVSFITGPQSASRMQQQQQSQQQQSHTTSHSTVDEEFRRFMQHYDFFLCSPLIRATAYECFARNSVAMHIACQERSRHTGVVPKEPLFFSAAILEVLDAIQTEDVSHFVRQEAAWTFQNLLLERPARVVLSALSQGVHLNAFNLQDVKGLSVPPQLDFTVDPMYHQHQTDLVVIRPVDAVQIVSGEAIQVSLSTWQRLIARSLGFQQSIRNVLLRSWLCAFGGERPPPAWQQKFHDQQRQQQEQEGLVLTMGSAQTSLLRALYEVYDSSARDPRRLIVRIPRFLDKAQTLGMKYVPTLDAEEQGQTGQNRGGRGRGRNSQSSGHNTIRNHVPSVAHTIPTVPTLSSPPSGGVGGFKLTLGSKYD